MATSTSARTVVLCAAGYAFAGIVGAIVAGTATSHQAVTAWRLAVWILSGIIFVAHVILERRNRGSSAVRTAQLAAYAVALGAFGVAVSALTRGLLLHGNNTTRLAFALVIFPLAAGVPAFLIAFVAAKVIRRETL